MMTKCPGAIRVVETQHLHEDNKNGENSAGVLRSSLPLAAPQTFRHFFISSAKAVVTRLVPASSFIPSDFVITVITYNESLS